VTASLNNSSLEPGILLQTLAEFRYELRRFLHFSESASLEAGLQPQQHQILLQVAGAPSGAIINIAYVADRLGLKHNSAVELVDRCVMEDLLERFVDPEDKRRAILVVTRKGKRILDRLSQSHVQELNDAAPRLALALKQIQKHNRVAITREAQ
jgi:DNA-binding MarR family transcriptional regulator